MTNQKSKPKSKAKSGPASKRVGKPASKSANKVVNKSVSKSSGKPASGSPSSRPSLHRWDAMPREALSPLLGRRLVTGERMMLAHVYLKRGCLVPLHSHMNEQMTYILEGALRLWLGTEGTPEHRAYDVRAGEVLVIPPNVPHRAEALEDTLDVDIFCPPRQDWLDGTDQYLRAPVR